MPNLKFIALSLLLFVLAVDAVSIQARHAHLGHTFAKRARCKNRPASSSSPPASTPAPPVNANATPTPTTTNKPAYTPPAPSGGRKAGIALAVWETGSVTRILTNFKNAFQTSFFYNWDTVTAVDANALGYNFVPIVKTGFPNYDKLVGGGYVLGFNEPNHEGAYIDPTYAATLWKERVLPLRAKGYKLISPATSSKADAIPWMKTFLAACGDGCVDIHAFHWYGTNADDLIAYTKKWHDTFQQPIWVTEFACHDFTNVSPCTDVNGFALKARDGFNGLSYVEHFFPFVVGPDDAFHGVNTVNRLLNGESPSALAGIYFA